MVSISSLAVVNDPLRSMTQIASSHEEDLLLPSERPVHGHIHDVIAIYNGRPTAWYGALDALVFFAIICRESVRQ